MAPASWPSSGPKNVDNASASPAPVHVSPDTNFLVEKRFMKRMARRTKPAESGCPVRRRKLLPVLNWHKSRKDVNRELHAENGNTSSSVVPQSESTIDSHVGPVLLPVQRPVSVGSESRKRITRKRSLSMSLAPELTAETCEERYIGRQEAFDELDGAGTLKSILQKEVALFLVELSPDNICHGVGADVPCAFCPWLHVKNSKGGLYWHVLHHHCAERHFVCSGTKQLRAIMSMFQCDLYRGRHQANYLTRSAALIRSSVGALSCTHRLHVDDEFRLLLSGSGPCFIGKEARTGTLPVRRVGNMYYDREFAEIVLRYLLQSGSRLTTSLNRFQCDIQLRGCVLGHMLPEHAKTMWPIVEDVLRSPDVTAWQQALMNNLHSSDGFRVLSLDGTMKIAMGLRRYETRIPRPAEGIVNGGVDDNTCVLTIRTLEGGLLNLAVVPNDSKPCHVVAVLESAIRPDQRCGVRWLVVDNATAALRSAVLNSFPRLQGIALDTCHLPIKYESVASNRKSPGSQMLRRLVSKFNVELPVDAPSDLFIPFNCDIKRHMDDKELYFYKHLCEYSLPREELDLAIADMKSARAWTDLASWIRSLAALATMFPDEVANKNTRKGKSRLRILMAAATPDRFEWYMNNARIRTTLSARESTLMGSGTCGNEALHAELRGVFRQVYNVSLPTFRVKLDLFHLAKLVSFDAARRIPMLRQMSQGRVRGTVFLHFKFGTFRVTHCM